MQKIELVVTHPGGAHKDDLLAACVLIAEHRCPVVRRDPSEAELADSAVAIVDIGGSHAPEQNNFDHHHFDRDHAPTCALSLVLQAKGLYEDALQLCDWLEPAEWFDSRGPNKTAEWLGVPRRAISQLNSPIDMTLLRRFAASPEHKPGETLYEYMSLVGEDLLQYLRDSRERIDLVSSRAERWTIEGEGDALEGVFLARAEPQLSEPSGAVAGYIRSEKLETQIAVMIYPDRRGDGYGISRYEDHPRLDFSRLDGQPDVHFAHKSGFMCKTSATDPQRLRALIQLATLPV